MDTTVDTPPRWVRDLIRLTPIRSQFVVAGNIRDSFMTPFEGGATLAPLLRCLWVHLSRLDYRFILVYDPIEGLRPYPRYLRGVAKHKLIFQLDASAVPGQVAGDALLCRVPCIGGNGTTERLAFPDLCGHGRTTEQLFDLAARLLEHPHDVASVMERAVSDARESLSYVVVAEQLGRFFTRIGR